MMDGNHLIGSIVLSSRGLCSYKYKEIFGIVYYSLTGSDVLDFDKKYFYDHFY